MLTKPLRPKSISALFVVGLGALFAFGGCSSSDVQGSVQTPTSTAVEATTTTGLPFVPTPTDEPPPSEPSVPTPPAPVAPIATDATPATPATTDVSVTITAEPTASSTPGSTTTSTVVATTGSAADQLAVGSSLITVGTSVEGRPIIAERFGTVGGRRVLVIGVIHGNEDAGVQIVDALRLRGMPQNVELWLVESMNPDGQAAQIRQNANGVDLNRNFPYKWGPIGERGNSQYAGTGPASEPETQAMVDFITELRPDIAIWYHQDANLVIPSTGRDGRIRATYAELTGLPIDDCCDGGGIYTGIAATWARSELKQDSDAVPFIVELPGGELSAAQVDAHASAVLTISAEG